VVGDVHDTIGCGDGLSVVTAAKKYGTRDTGVYIVTERITEANANAKQAGVTDKVKFIEGNLFDVDLSNADVVTLYLLPSVNMKLRPHLTKLKPGTRIASHAFDIGDWKPANTINVNGSTIHLSSVTATNKLST